MRTINLRCGDGLYRVLNDRENLEYPLILIFNNEEFNSMSKYEYQLCMFDHVHPTLAGYFHWLPYFEDVLEKIFSK